MEWTENLNKIMAYVESHLDGELDPDEIGRLAACPYAMFQRIFGQPQRRPDRQIIQLLRDFFRIRLKNIKANISLSAYRLHICKPVYIARREVRPHLHFLFLWSSFSAALHLPRTRQFRLSDHSENPLGIFHLISRKIDIPAALLPLTRRKQGRHAQYRYDYPKRFLFCHHNLPLTFNRPLA